MRRNIVLGAALVLTLAGSASPAAASTRPRDQQLAARIAPTAADLGAGYRRESPAQVHAKGLACPAGSTGCAWRFFALPSDPPGIAGAVAAADVFATAAAARSAYETALQNLRRTRHAGAAGARETISLRSEAHRSAGGVPATLLVFRVTATGGAPFDESYRVIVLLDGRAEVSVSFKLGRTVAFAATARRLAARLRPVGKP
ncbi:MAG TPA: hypothetical protein VHC67_02425 [Gaiellaceae bacterium]|nr:hypothetical protein [Gaiellaceae bacterium]